MPELIAIIILACSLIGMGILIFRKISILVELPEVPEKKPLIGLKLKEKIKILNPFRSFSGEVFLQKILSKIRILILKTDSKTFNWLQKLRERMKKKKLENDNYWEELKKNQKGKVNPKNLFEI